MLGARRARGCSVCRSYTELEILGKLEDRQVLFLRQWIVCVCILLIFFAGSGRGVTCQFLPGITCSWAKKMGPFIQARVVTVVERVGDACANWLTQRHSAADLPLPSLLPRSPAVDYGIVTAVGCQVLRSRRRMV